MKYQEMKQDLFLMDKSYALAHCISMDCAMGAGIAKEFRRRYPKMPKEVGLSRPHIGEAVKYQEDRIIFNLVTKEKYWHKPTYKSFTKSIESLKAAMERDGIQKLAIPLLGAGLDKLDWEKNRDIIQHIFQDTEIEIVVCRL